MQKYIDEVRQFLENYNGQPANAGQFAEIETQIALFKRLLAPKCVPGKELIRIGAKHDGGYLMFEPGQNGIAYSLGIGTEVAWDLEMAKRGFKVFQYDGSVDAPPVNHENFSFNKVFIGGKNNGTGYKSLEQLLTDNGHLKHNNLVLQMDIEGAEWAVLETITPQLINAFEQIIIEFHVPLHQLVYLPMCNCMLKKLNLSHQAVHAHVNNDGFVCSFGEQEFWSVVEVSYLRRDKHSFVKSTAHYPLELDAPCNTSRKDIDAGFWGLV